MQRLYCIDWAGNRIREIEFYTGSTQFGATHDRHWATLKIVQCVEMEGRKYCTISTVCSGDG
jgi:hypothetical protein